MEDVLGMVKETAEDEGRMGIIRFRLARSLSLSTGSFILVISFLCYLSSLVIMSTQKTTIA